MKIIPLVRRGLRKALQTAVMGIAVVLALAFMVTLFSTAFAIRTYRSFDVPDKSVLEKAPDRGLKIADKNGEVFFTFETAGKHAPITVEEMPQHVQEALIAAEDSTFYSHRGFSVRSIARAAKRNWEEKDFVLGGSTITQQLVKNVWLTSDKSLKRKYREVIAAVKIERHFSKDEILELYLNSAYFGEGAIGIEAAAQTYFGKPAKELTVGEGSLLIGLLPAPSALSPVSGDREAAEARQAYVLRRMLQEHYLSEEEYEAAKAETMVFASHDAPENSGAVHYALLVRDLLFEKFSPEYVSQAGLTVKTALDPIWQQEAETALQTQLQKLAYAKAGNGAVVVIDPATREVRALAGSRGWDYPGFGKTNMAMSPRQTGSAFKPIVYAAGLENRVLTASSILEDKPIEFVEGWQPENYDGRFRGRVLVREALANSLNVPAVQAIQKIGTAQVSRLAEQLGITTLSKDAPYNLSLALGTEAISLVELTNVYAAFADGGLSAPPVFITEIHDKQGNQVPFEAPAKQVAVTPETAFIVSSILSDNPARAETFGTSLKLSRPAAAKTGTTQDWRDSWTLGYTPNVAVGVWLGNNDNSAMHRVAGASGAAPVWRTLMERYFQDLPAVDFLAPQHIVAASVCRHNGLLAPARGGGGRGTYTEYFLPGTEPTKRCLFPRPTPEATLGIEPTPRPLPTPQPPSFFFDDVDDLEDLENFLQPTPNLFQYNQQIIIQDGHILESRLKENKNRGKPGQPLPTPFDLTFRPTP